MILEIEHHHEGYARIIEDCRGSGSAANDNDDDDNAFADNDDEGGSVLMLCNAEADALAAARILSFLLRSDGIAYQLLPCSSQRSMADILRNTPHETVRALVLFNLGATVNLVKLFGPLLNEHVKIYVMDCRRPVHLANIHAGDNVVMFWDNKRGIEDGDVPSDGDYLSANDESSDDEDEAGSSSSSDSDDDDEDSDSDDDSDEGETEFDAPTGGRRKDATADDGDGGFSDTDTPATNTMASKRGSASRRMVDDSDYDAEDETGNGGANGGDNDEHDGNDDHGDHDGNDVGNADDARSNQSKRRKLNVQDDDYTTVASTYPSTAPEDASTLGSPSQRHQYLTPQQRHQERKDRVNNYYNTGSFYGTPASYTAYRLATQMRFGSTGDLLWLACVGITDAYLHSRLDVAVFTQLAGDLDNNCRRLFPNDMYTRSTESVFAEDLMSGATSRDNTKITFSDNGRILSQSDYKFFLLRHSSLYDSMICSDYVSTKLQVWTKRGRHQLRELLAKMGYPLEECRQPYPFMKPRLRRRLKERLGEYAEEYGLEKFEFTSFFRVTGYQSLLAASDTSHAITALLECDPPSTGGGGGAAGDGANVANDEEQQTLEAFNIAYDALNTSIAPTMSLNSLHGGGQDASSLINGGNLTGSTGLGAGIRLAMKVQKAILSTAVSLTERNAITRLRHFRYAYLTCTSSFGEGNYVADSTTSGRANPQDSSSSASSKQQQTKQQQHTFSKPLALSRLAQYLMSMHRENGSWAGTKARPLVLMAEKPQTKSFLVVGYEYPEHAGNFVKNRFGYHFQLAAESMDAAAKFDTSFDSNVVEVSAQHVQRFIEQLHYMMDSA